MRLTQAFEKDREGGVNVGFMQSARVVGRSPVECSHFVFLHNISLSNSLLSVRSFLYAAYILYWTSLLTSYSFVGWIQSYWHRKRSSCDKGLSFISWIRWSITGRYIALCQQNSGFVAGTFTLCCCLPVVLGMLGSMSNSAAIIFFLSSYTSFQTDGSPLSTLMIFITTLAPTNDCVGCYLDEIYALSLQHSWQSNCVGKGILCCK